MSKVKVPTRAPKPARKSKGPTAAKPQAHPLLGPTSEGYALRELFELGRSRIVLRVFLDAIHDGLTALLEFPNKGQVDATESGLAAACLIDALEALETAHDHLVQEQGLQELRGAERAAGQKNGGAK